MSESQGRRRSDGAQTLARGLDALVALGTEPGGLTTTELANRLGVHRSIAHRMLATMIDLGFAQRGQSGKMVIGPALFALADSARPPLQAAAVPVLTKLADNLGASACLVEATRDAVIATVVVEATGLYGPRFTYRVGSRDPIDRGSGAYGARAAGPEEPGEPEGVTRARRLGYAVSSGEVVQGAYGVAAPIFGHPTGTRAAVNIITSDPTVAERAPSLVRSAADELAGAR